MGRRAGRDMAQLKLDTYIRNTYLLPASVLLYICVICIRARFRFPVDNGVCDIYIYIYIDMRVCIHIFPLARCSLSLGQGGGGRGRIV